MTIIIDRGLAWLLVLVIVAFGIYWLSNSRKQVKKCPREVGIEALRLNYSKKLVPAPPIQLSDKKVLTEAVNEVNDYLMTTIMSACRKAAEGGKTLQIEINTTGGDYIIARSVAGVLRHFKKEIDLRIVVTGKCQSAGMIILMAVNSNQRYAVDGSEFLVHAADKSKTGRRDRRTRKVDAEMLETIASGTQIDRTSLAAHLKSGKDCLFSAEEALLAGVIGAII